MEAVGTYELAAAVIAALQGPKAISWGIGRYREKNGNGSTKTKKAVEHLEETLGPHMKSQAESSARIAKTMESMDRTLDELNTSIAVLKDRVPR